MNKRQQAQKVLPELKRAVGLTYSNKLAKLMNANEKAKSRKAYSALCFLFNSLHRHLINKKKLN